MVGKVFVTGGAGFIGSHLVERLARSGWRVLAVDNFDPFYDPAVKRRNLDDMRSVCRFEFEEGDIRRARWLRSVLKDFLPDVVVHLAARAGVRPSIAHPLLYNEVNVRGTLNILEACRWLGLKRLVFASSSSVYGGIKRVPFRVEDAADRPVSPYAATKRAGELMCYTYHHLYGINVSCLRFFTVYGPRQRPEMAIHKFTRLIHRGEEVPLYGDGTSQRDYTYIDDIIDGVVAAVERPFPYEILNLGDAHPVPLMKLVHLIEEALGKKARIRWLPDQPGDVPITFADISRSTELLGYQPRIPIEEGIARFVKWFRERN